MTGNQFLTPILFIITIFSNHAAFSHGKHKHLPKVAECAKAECTKAEIKKATNEIVIPKYIAKGKIAKSWSNAELKNIQLKNMQKNQSRKEWVVQYFNKNEDVQKQNLYIFVKPNGVLIAVNHSGK